MSFTPNATWEEGRASGRLVVLLDIYDGATHWKCLSGSINTGSDLHGTEIALHKVSPMAVEYDPVSREMSRGELWADVDDEWLRPIVVANRLKGQRVDCSIGWHNCDEADFELLFRGLIEDIHPVSESVIKIDIGDLFQVLDTTDLNGTFINKHLLEVLYHATDTSVFGECGIVAAQVNTTSFDPTDAAYTSSISHFCTSGFSPGTHAKKNIKTDIKYRRDYTKPGVPIVQDVKKSTSYEPMEHAEINAKQTMDDLCQLMYGMVRVDSDGKLEFKLFDSTESTVADIDENSIIPGSFKQMSSDGVVINQIMCSYGNNQKMRLKSAASQTAYAQTGSSKRIFNFEIDTNWIDQLAKSSTTTLNSADTAVRITGPCHNFSGNRWPGYPAGSQPASAAASASRPIYIRITNIDSGESVGVDLSAEVAKYTASATSDGSEATQGTLHVYDPDDGSRSEVHFNKFLKLSSGSRGQLGTTSIANATSGINIRVADVTMLVYCGQAILDRCEYGMGVVELAVPMTFFGVQEGDLVTLTYDKYLAYDTDGITSSAKWEIVKKEVILFEGEPRINLRLASAETGTATMTAPSILRGHRVEIDKALDFMMSEEDLIKPHVVSGGTFTPGVGLAGTLNSTIVSGHYGRSYIPANTTRTYTASRDTYVRFDTEEQSIVYYEVANSGTEPPLQHSEIRLQKIVTDGAGITTDTSQIERTKAMDASVAVIAETVTQAEVGENEIGFHRQNISSEIGVAINLNGDFSQFTRG